MGRQGAGPRGIRHRTSEGEMTVIAGLDPVQRTKIADLLGRYCPAHLTAALGPLAHERLTSAPEAAGPDTFRAQLVPRAEGPGSADGPGGVATGGGGGAPAGACLRGLAGRTAGSRTRAGTAAGLPYVSRGSRSVLEGQRPAGRRARDHLLRRVAWARPGQGAGPAPPRLPARRAR